MAEDEAVQDGAGGEDDEESLPLQQKVAIVMVALGEEVSGEVMKHLSDYEIEEITQAIAGLWRSPLVVCRSACSSPLDTKRDKPFPLRAKPVIATRPPSVYYFPTEPIHRH
jgi:hypothetical protein